MAPGPVARGRAWAQDLQAQDRAWEQARAVAWAPPEAWDLAAVQDPEGAAANKHPRLGQIPILLTEAGNNVARFLPQRIVMNRTQVTEFSLPSVNGSGETARGSILFIGTATVLLRYAGFTMLTDPNFLHRGEYAHLGYGLRSQRLTEPAIPFESLPEFDMVLLSHLHEDHFDRRVERLLNPTIPIITTPRAAQALSEKGFQRTTGLSTWQEASFIRGGIRLRISSMPGRHGPWLVSRLLPPVMGSMLEFIQADEVLLRLYVSGDTLLFDQLAEIKGRYASIDKALIHLGGTRILGLLVTMDAEQGVGLLKMLKPKVAVPIHYNDYTVFKSTLADFQREVREAALETNVEYLRHGDTYTFDVHAPRAVGL